MRKLPAYIVLATLAISLYSLKVQGNPVYHFSQPENIIAFLFEIKTLPDSIALEYYRDPIQEILTNPTGTLSKKDLAYLHYVNGKIYQKEKIFEKALEEFYLAFELARAENHLIEKGIARMEIGAILMEKNAYKEAGDHLQSALAILRHTDGTEYVPRAKYLYAKWLTFNGNTKEAIHQMADAVEGFNLEAKFEKGAAIALDFGIQLSRLGMFQQAEEFLKAALFYYRMEENPEAMGRTFLALTENKILEKDYDDAMIFNQQALNIFRAGEDTFILGMLQWNFAQIFLGMKQKDKALIHMARALDFLKENLQNLDAYRLILSIAEMYEKLGLEEKAKKEFRFLAIHTPLIAGNFLDKEIIDVTGKYEAALKTQAYASEIEKLTREKRMAQKTSWLLVAIFLLTMALLAVAWKAHTVRLKLKSYRDYPARFFAGNNWKPQVQNTLWFRLKKILFPKSIT